jgi:hypothetical protein
MHLTARARLGTAALLVSALGLALPATAPAGAAPAAHPSARAGAHAPTLTFKINKGGSIKLTHGPRSFRPGRVAFKVTSKNKNATLAFVRFTKGYTFKSFRKDLAGTNKGNMKALKHAIKHTTFLGGAGSIGPGGASGTVVLPTAGAYTVYNFGGKLPKSPLTLHAAGRPAHRATPKHAATLTAVNGLRFGGATTIPQHGTMLLKNVSSDSPHLFAFLQVKPGTTVQDILTYFQSGSQAPPSFFVAPGPSSEVIGPHKSMTLNYSMRAGTYAELCFFPDPNMHGMPHAAMGMIRIITVR